MWIDKSLKKRYDSSYKMLTQYEELPVTQGTGRTERTMRSVRESLDMTLPELALRTGLTEQRIRKLESRTVQPSPDEASRIAEALDVSPDELLEIVQLHSGTLRNTDLYALLETIDDNARRFISDKEIEQLENALRLSIDVMDRFKRDR